MSNYIYLSPVLLTFDCWPALCIDPMTAERGNLLLNLAIVLVTTDRIWNLRGPHASYIFCHMRNCDSQLSFSATFS